MKETGATNVNMKKNEMTQSKHSIRQIGQTNREIQKRPRQTRPESLKRDKNTC